VLSPSVGREWDASVLPPGEEREGGETPLGVLAPSLRSGARTAAILSICLFSIFLQFYAIAKIIQILEFVLSH
ncbi:MAG: hypothetical protein SOY58_06425, partial [Candidatus Onthovivens sp.]|nr:hypothetical protein [Candidatus Onthovivens sp.]